MSMSTQSSHSKDSYAQRRELFKNIWDTAVKLDEKDKEPEHPNVAKPKVIKTLRLSNEGINIAKTKRQRIKNLRIVCNRLLDICNKQESEESLYDRITAARRDSCVTSTMYVHQRKRIKKRQKSKRKKKIEHTYELAQLPQVDVQEDTDEEGPSTHRGTKPVRDLSPLRIERAMLVQRFVKERQNLKKLENAPTPRVNDTPRRVSSPKQKKDTDTVQQETTSLDIDDGHFTHRGTKSLRDLDSPRIEGTNPIQRFENEGQNLEKISTPQPVESDEKLGDARCKEVKKTQNRRKSLATPSPPPRVNGTSRRKSPRPRKWCPIGTINLNENWK
ncbi:uncharacterized protein LOC134806426 isoform X2 [Cydia splendana]|uniref:uncharacterized protein LOC134806426 isoform X2 n=1 Tax=Cydia splendana TaxID=1100963 RepID=UPI00300C822D